MASRWGHIFDWISTFEEKSADRDKQGDFFWGLREENERQMMRESIHCHFNIFGTGMCEQQQLTFENKILKNSKTLNWAVGWLQAVTGKVSTLSGSSSLGLSWTTHNFYLFISKLILSRFENLKFCQKGPKWPKLQFSKLNKIKLEMNEKKLWVVHDSPWQCGPLNFFAFIAGSPLIWTEL